MEDFHIGPWLVEPRRLALTQGHGSVLVKPRSMAVLVALADAQGEVVERRTLMAQVWGDAEVTDDVLTQSIVELRRALGDDARRPRYIETIKRVGFRLIPESDHARWSSRARLTAMALLLLSAAAGIWVAYRVSHGARDLDTSLAITPISAVGGEAVTASYAEALTEAVRSAVSGYPELRLVDASDNPDTVRDVSYVFGGNVQGLRDRLRVWAHLTRADDRQTVWAQTFEVPSSREITDVSELASNLGRFIRLQLVQDWSCEFVRRSSSSSDAADAYCAALAEANRWRQTGDRNPDVVLNDAQRALALDPTIIGAYRLVAGAYESLGSAGLMDWRDASRHAHAALEQGLVLSPDNPWLTWTLAHVEISLDLDYPGAEDRLRALLPSSPGIEPWYHFALGRMELTRGNVRDALEHFRLALRLDDTSAGVYLFYADALWCGGEDRKAIEAADAGMQLAQSGSLRVLLSAIKSKAQAALGEIAAANATLDDALAAAEPTFKTLLVGPLARVGRTDEARQLLGQLEAVAHPPVYSMVRGYAALEDERALEWIHKAIDQHSGGILLTLRTDPDFSELRKDARWGEVLAHLQAEETKGSAARSSASL